MNISADNQKNYAAAIISTVEKSKGDKLYLLTLDTKTVKIIDKLAYIDSSQIFPSVNGVVGFSNILIFKNGDFSFKGTNFKTKKTSNIVGSGIADIDVISNDGSCNAIFLGFPKTLSLLYVNL